MATRRSGRSGNGRSGSNRYGNGRRESGSRGGRANGNGVRQRPERKGQSSALVYAEIAGAALVAILLIVVFGGGTRNEPPRVEEQGRKASRDWIPKEETARPEKKEKVSWRPQKPAWTGPTNLDGEKGVPPTRSVPAVDLKRGNALYLEAKTLYNQQEHLREKGRSDESRRMLRQAYEKLEQAFASVKALDDWLMEAQLEGWTVDKETFAKKQDMDRWDRLRALIHKVLPKTD